MNKASLREKVIEEIRLLPDERLDDAYRLIHHFRLGLERRRPAEDIMSFAGVWRDMPEDDFEALLLEWQTRRQTPSRRRHEADLD